MAANASDEDQTYSTSEVARLLGVTDATVRRYVATGFLPEPGWVRVGRRRHRQYSKSWVENARRKLDGET